MEDLNLIAFLLGVALSHCTDLLLPLSLAASAVGAGANVEFEPVAY